MRTKSKIYKIISGALAAATLIGTMPVISYAAQSNEYVDPADVWMEANGRTNEFDINATTTYETVYCPVCDMETTQLTYRVPEYTKSGETALNHNVMYSDGTCTDGESTGNLDDGTPGVDAYYTGMHWTKSVCQNCGVINSVDGTGSYSFGKNVYGLNKCDHNFFLDFDNTTYTPYDSEYHTTILKAGEYCQFCKGTYAKATEQLDRHNFNETVDGELGNQRFHITGECEDCGYIKNEYLAAKSVVQSYYGKVDGDTHTVTVSDLSEDGVNTSIRYGTEASKCDLTSAPNYTAEGYYPVYYEITYSYGGEKMVENGVSYVWLLADDKSSGDVAVSEVHTHDYRYLESVAPSCTDLGYDRFQCSVCGALMKTNYTPATGHDYETVVIREASCTQGGLELHMCKKCGSYYTETTSMTDHIYTTNTVAATCTMNGYTEHTCINCNYRYITDLTPLAKHDYREKVTPPTCTTKGFTTYTCADCGEVYISGYTDATGHEWDNGRTVTSSTCESEGVMEYHCKHCDEKMIQAISATGHTPGAAATCTEPQICTSCGAILEMPTGHHYSETITPPSCTAMGYTTYTCDICGDSYTGSYTDMTEHHYEGVITPSTCTELGYTTYTCTECGDSYKSDYTDKKPHSYKAVVTPATCTTMGFITYTCEECGDSYVADYTEVLPHNYTKQVIEPTCTSQGYTIYTCPDCGNEYIGDEKESIAHTYTSTVTEPTCTDMGYTTNICVDCGYTYISDYTNPLGHDYVETVTAPTCTTIGYSTFTCSRCGDSYTGNETAKSPHDYDKIITEPTCTKMGYTVFKCKDCGDTYTGDYTDAKGHSYKEEVIAPTCTEMGYSIFTCEVCGDSYTGNETSKTEHSYNQVVTEPTCTELGFTTITCDNCGDTHKINYVEAAGHKRSDWIIDVPATIEAAGSKHIECTVCGEILETAEIAKLSDHDNSNEDGNSIVGDYSILITDMNSKPIFDSEISIDMNDDITITLPDGRLLSAEDITTVTVTYIESNNPAEGIRIFVADTSDNAATGRTDVNGQLSVPNKQSSTGNSNGTVTDGENTYVVVVTNKDGQLIPNCDVTVGENYSINVKLPAGTAFDKDNRITTTVVTEKGEPVSGLRVQMIGDGDFVENGYTNIRGQVTLPMSNSDTTDENGNAEVGEIIGENIYDYIVTVSDEHGFIPDALITMIAEDNSILVCLPEGKTIDYYNRTTVKVVRSDGTPVEGWKVSVYNKDGRGLRTEVTDENGIVVVPPLSEVPIAKPTPAPDPGAEATPLPGVETTPTPEETDIPVETEKPNATDEPVSTEQPSTTPAPSEQPSEKPSATDIPAATKTPSEPTVTPTATPEPTSTPNIGDGAVVENKDYKYRVYVWDNGGAITDFGLIKLQENGNIEIELPATKLLDVENRTYIKVINENDKSPVKGITVNVTDCTGAAASDITNSNGIAVVPVKDTDITDGNGNAQIKDNEGNLYNVNVSTETKGNIENAVVTISDSKISVTLPDGTVIDHNDRTTVTVTDRDAKPVSGISVTVKDSKGGDRTETTDADGKVVVPPLSEDYTDKDGSAKVNEYVITVEDTKTKIENAFISIADGKISVKLPEGHTLTTSNQTTVTVTKDNEPVKDMSVTVTDSNDKTAAKNTDSNGKITVPVKTSSGSSGGSSGGSGGGGGIVSSTYNVTVTDKDGKTVSVTKSVKNDDITLTLPSGMTLDGNNYYTIVVTDRQGKAAEGVDVTLKDKDGNANSGITDENGQLILPDVTVTHNAYIEGYDDGTFRPEANITRAEAAAIFARNISEQKNEKINNGKSSFADVKTDKWYTSYIAYLEEYGIIDGYDDGTFKPDAEISRAEFVTMAERAYKLFGEVRSEKENIFTDIDNSHWAAEHIYTAIAMDWIKGYADGTFRPDNKITRAEVVTIVNRVTGRNADEDFIDKHLSDLLNFTDMKDKGYWAYYSIAEAANTHDALILDDIESWIE